ncbi:hypothetical protein [Pseudomonas sp. PLMAX]|uniref:hypothetical protein n=1 Tax=Pseudomonas sp. PLMAX TaxID=2201998 RepID=UPI0038BCB170
MITRILAALALAALSFAAAAHNEYSVGSTEIELYELELSPNETIKLKHLKIYSEKQAHDDEDAFDNALPAPPQNQQSESRPVADSSLSEI